MPGPSDDTAQHDQPGDQPEGQEPAGPEGGAPQGLAELVSLLLSTPSVEDYLGDLARVAAGVLAPEELSCGITLRRDGHPLTVASSDALAMAVDEVQYGLDAGPCLEALDTGAVVTAPDLSEEDRWDGYVGHALSYGLASSLSVPLSAEGQVTGALNLYASAAHAFDAPEAVARASALAAQASALLGVVVRQARQAQLSESLREALGSRAVIDQAIGILMGQQKCTSGEAFGILRMASQHRNRKLREIAADLITSATGHPPQASPFADPT